ncbi:hypothetical protein LBMAG42_37470 [Deltaproteobacteria bacterium]|nr:hypothetical protein LBMAG42_37470 [Deltaproteobacteria bacterium]
MATFEVVSLVPSTPDRVWAVLADVDRWVEWAPTVTGVTALGSSGLRVGAQYRLVQPKLQPAVWTVDALEPGRSFSWVSASPGMRTLAFHLVEPVEGGTRLTLRIELSGAMAWLGGWLGGATIRSYMQQEAEALARRVAT